MTSIAHEGCNWCVIYYDLKKHGEKMTKGGVQMQSKYVKPVAVIVNAFNKMSLASKCACNGGVCHRHGS